MLRQAHACRRHDNNADAKLVHRRCSAPSCCHVAPHADVPAPRLVLHELVHGGTEPLVPPPPPQPHRQLLLSPAAFYACCFCSCCYCCGRCGWCSCCGCCRGCCYVHASTRAASCISTTRRSKRADAVLVRARARRAASMTARPATAPSSTARLMSAMETPSALASAVAVAPAVLAAGVGGATETRASVVKVAREALAEGGVCVGVPSANVKRVAALAFFRRVVACSRRCSRCHHPRRRRRWQRLAGADGAGAAVEHPEWRQCRSLGS